MIKGNANAPVSMALALLLTAVTLLAACAPTSGNSQSSESFEIRSMIAADRQQLQSMDERLRRMESQIQDLVHNAPSSTVSSAPAPPASPPSIPVAPPETIGAPPAPGGATAPNTPPPGAMAAPPGAPANPVGAPEAAAAPAVAPEGGPAPSASAAEGERTTIASAPENPAGTAPGTEGNSEEAANPPPPQEGGNEDSGPEASAAPGTEAQPEGENGAAAPAEEGAAGEQVASNPPAAPPENAPAAIPPARWPADLAREIQSAGNEKGPAGKVFRSGLQAMQNRDYAAAVDRFSYLQKKFPHSDLTEPAAYFSASALNEMGKYDQAILQYNDLVMRYPKGKYAGEALLREAQDFIQINDKVDARLTLQKLINDQPGTPQAATAQAMMKTLESE
jgi:TolA-binding protein